MNKEELEGIFSLDCEDRHDYFLSVVGEEREIWILINSEEHFLKLHAEDQGGFEYLPIWPSSEFAEAYASEDADLTPKSIPLPQFLKKWLPGLKGDDIEVGVFPAPDKSVWMTHPSEIERDLREELSRF